MRRFLRSWWLRGFVILVVLAGAWRVIRPHLRPAPPKPDAQTLAHAANVRILRDSFGVPHIFGKSDADAAFGLAYAHAEDDWLTIQGVLAAARGELGLLFFSGTARSNDYYVSLIKVAAQTDKLYPTLSPEVRAVLEAYARGLNYYAYLHPDEADGRLLPISGRDIAAGFAHKLPILVGFTEALSATLADPPLMKSGGSNAHAVHRSRSTDDVTRLNVNSHQPWEGPVAWYEAQVHSEEGWNMTGGTFPGAPFILHGHNDHLGWAHTVNTPDLVDVYKLTMKGEGSLEYKLDDKWLPLEVTEASIPIDTGFFTWTAHKDVYWSVHGPVMETDRGFYAFRYASMDRAVLAAEQWFRMNKATSFDEWKAAMAIQGVPMFNTVYADRDNIFYIYNALLPRRVDGVDWKGLLPGDRADLVWEGYTPFDALPQVKNPASGFVQNCNSTPFGTTVGDDNPRPVSPTAGIETDMTNRALRSNALLAAGPVSRADFLRMKWDRTYAREAKIFTRFVGPLLAGFVSATDEERAGIELLRGWDGGTDEGSAAAGLAVSAWRFMSDDGQVEKKGKTTDPAVAFRRGLALARGRTLGEVQRLHRGATDLPLGGGPDVLNAAYTHERDGQLVAFQGDSYVLEVEFAATGVTSSSISNYGASNRPSSPHYADQAPLFVRHELKKAWRDETELRAHLEREYQPGKEIGGK